MANRKRAPGPKRLSAASLALALAPAVLVLSSAPAPLAQTPASGFAGLSGTNSKKPIDIESDRLEVDDKRHVATFIGNVSATQGDFNLRAPRLEVTYESAPQAQQTPNSPQGAKPAKPVSAQAPSTSGDPLSSGQIRFIHAFGGTVVITNPKDSQEATGEDAFYDVKAQKITLTGKKVVLKQKLNVVEGRKLLIDLATGQATVIPDDDSVPQTASGHKPRVRAVFQQEGGRTSPAAPPPGTGNKGVTAPGQPAAAQQKPAPAPQAAPGTGWQPQSR